MRDFSRMICLACGAELPEALRWVASLRCQTCREVSAPLRTDFARWEREFSVMRARLDELRAWEEAPTAS
jgi:hypothetical protein